MSAHSHATTYAPPVAAEGGKTSLIGLDRPELEAALAALGLPRFRANQVWHWLYHRGVTSFAAMTTLARPVRELLDEQFSITRPEVTRDQASTDGTRKWLIRMEDGQEVEAVHIPEIDRGALCVSSQVGCTLTCRFCHTGTQPLVRNLGPAEVLAQILTARDALGEWPAPGANPNLETSTLTNIVMMGMGEPLYNYDNVAKALRIVMDGEGIAISKRRITLSTSGVVPMMKRCGAELGVNLAVSLHAVTDAVRDEIMPINRAYPIAELMDACRNYPGSSNARRITFEYVMLKGVNDSLTDARELVRLLDGVPAKVNLIPFNPWPGSGFECSSRTQIDKFARVLMDAGYASPVREPRGRDIMAACGQLRSDSLRVKKLLAEKPDLPPDIMLGAA
jgi:23S rRNA (adenine2503-C2)-methyltransferase